jgi:hypothetical protein
MGIREELDRMLNDSDAGHKRLIEYVVRQLNGGRTLDEVMEDPYVTNRSDAIARRALLDEPEVVTAASEEALAGLRQHLEDLHTAGSGSATE